MCGVLPPRLLQDHSPSGDPRYTALVILRTGSGEALVKGSDPSKRLKSKHHSHEKTPLVAGLDADLALVSISYFPTVQFPLVT